MPALLSRRLLHPVGGTREKSLTSPIPLTLVMTHNDPLVPLSSPQPAPQPELRAGVPFGHALCVPVSLALSAPSPRFVMTMQKYRLASEAFPGYMGVLV